MRFQSKLLLLAVLSPTILGCRPDPWMRPTVKFPPHWQAQKDRKETPEEIEKREYQKARRFGVPGLREFIKKYPESPFRAEAQSRIDELLQRQQEAIQKLQDDSFARAQKIGTAGAYRDFIRMHPDSQHVDEARSALLTIEAKTAIIFNTAEYQIPYRTIEDYVAESTKVGEEIGQGCVDLKGDYDFYYDAACLYFAEGKVLERHLGYHYMTFRLYDNALFYTNKSMQGRLKKAAAALVPQILQRVNALAERKFQALSDISHTDIPEVDDPALVVVEVTNHTAGEGYAFRVEDFDSSGGGFLTGNRSDCFQEGSWRGDRLLREKERDYPDRSPCWHSNSYKYAFLVVPPEYEIVAFQSPFSKNLIGWTLREAPGTNSRPFSYDKRWRDVQDFIARFPEFRSRGAIVLDDLSYLRAAEKDSLALYEEYISTYKAGRHLGDAEKGIEKKRAEIGRDSKSREDIIAFLAAYPDSHYRSEMLELLEYRDFQAAEKARSVPALEAFIQEYRTGKHIAAAIAALEAARAFELVRQSNNPIDVQTFLAKYPSSVFSDEAHALTLFFKAQTSSSVEECSAFLALYHQLGDPQILSSKYNQVLESVRQRVDSNERTGKGGASAHILLHKELHDYQLLDKARELAETTDEELYVFTHMDDDQKSQVFLITLLRPDGAEARVKEDSPWPLGNSRVTTEPRFPARLVSLARKGTYRVTVEMKMTMGYRQTYVGIAWLAPTDRERQWTQEYTALASATVAPQGRSDMTFEFPPIELRSQEGLPGYSFNTTITSSEPSYRIISIEPQY